MTRALLLAALLSPLVAPAAADPADAPPPAPAARPAPRYGFGARIGGWGFRRDTGTLADGWNKCRMNGLGVFGQRGFGRYLFVETGVDLYFTEAFPMQPVEGDLPINRTSGIVTAAAGLRAAATSWLTGYTELGLGVELSRVSVPYNGHSISDNLALPVGFLGIGGDIKVGARTFIGASLRANVMGAFDYDPKKLAMQPGWTQPPSAGEVFDPSPGLAAQAQFYVRRDL